MAEEDKNRAEYLTQLSQLLNRVAELESLLEKEKKRAEDLKESEQNYRTIAEGAADFIWSMDLTKQFTFLSPSVEIFLGYSPSEIKSIPFKNFLTPESYKYAKKILSKFFEKAGKKKKKDRFLRPIELEHVHKDGRTIWCEVASKILYSDKGEVTGIFGFTRNITIHKQMEEALKESELKYRSLFNNAQVGLYRSNLYGGKIEECNDLFAELLGYENRGECIERFKASDHFVDSEELERMTDIIMKEEGVKNFTAEVIRKDGSPIWVSYSARLFPGSNCIEGVIIDITRRKKAREALKKSEEKFRDLYKKAPMAYFSFNRDGRITNFNKMAIELSGYEREELHNMEIAGLFSSDASIETGAKEILSRFLEGELIRNERVRIARKDGIPAWGGMTINSVRDSYGKPVSGRCIVTDITDHVNMEGQLEQDKKLKAIGTLFGGLANEFNNFLTGIQGNISLMLMDAEEIDPQYDRLNNIEQYVQKGFDLAGRMVGAVEGGDYNPEPIDISSIINRVSKVIAATRKKVNIHRHPEENIWMVAGDQARIGKVILDLHVSAWRNMPGGLDVYFRADNRILRQDQCKPFGGTPGRHVKITMADTAEVLKEKPLLKIERPFYSEEDFNQDEGISLASAYSIVKRHKGFINAFKTRDGSTVFNIFLPALKKRQIEEDGIKDDIFSGSETILMVDDEEMIIEVIYQLLSRMGYKVLVARNGEEAINTFKKKVQQIDLVILDLIIPDMGGETIFKAIRELNPRIKVLLLSGFMTEEDVKELLAGGRAAFLKKPFKMNAIIKKVRETLDLENA